MIRYNPIDTDASTVPVKYLPSTCFIMCQLRRPVPEEQVVIRRELSKFLVTKGFKEIDAGSSLTGRDFPNKVWGMAFQVPIGIGIITQHTNSSTVANIFYEMGLLQAL